MSWLLSSSFLRGGRRWVYSLLSSSFLEPSHISRVGLVSTIRLGTSIRSTRRHRTVYHPPRWWPWQTMPRVRRPRLVAADLSSS